PRMARQLLRSAYAGRAKALSLLRRPSEALQDRKRAVELNGLSGGDESRLGRALSLVQHGDVPKAVAEADLLAEREADSGQTLFGAARVFAFAAEKTDDSTMRERYAARAVGLLRTAVAKGYADVARLKSDKGFAILRD